MSDSLLHLQAALRLCRRCQDAGFRVFAPPIFSGQSSARLMTIGQAPGRVENERTHAPFSGPSGRRLFRWLAEAGWSEDEFRSSSYMTAITKCFPGANLEGRGDRLASKAEQALCRSWLEAELALVRPEIVVPIGGLAIALLLGKLRLDEAVGRRFVRPLDDALLTPWAQAHLPGSASIIPLPHPSGASQWPQQEENKARLQQALEHLRAARLSLINPGPA
jgi:uracil-DNA glycosylase